MIVWIVLVAGHVNSVWSTQDAAAAHARMLFQVNGEQLPVQVMDIEVRDAA